MGGRVVHLSGVYIAGMANPQPSLIVTRTWNPGTEDIGKDNLEDHGAAHSQLRTDIDGKAADDKPLENFQSGGGTGTVPVVQSDGSVAMQIPSVSIGAYTDRSGSRTLNNVRLNQTGGPLQVRVVASNTAGGTSELNLLLDGVVVDTAVSGGSNRVAVDAIVRNQSEYEVATPTSADHTLVTWVEREWTTATS